MFSKFTQQPQPDAASAQLQAWVRERFRLGGDATVLVTEHPGELPGSPAPETLIAFWTDGADGQAQRHHVKVFKPLAEVSPDDLPPWWMKDALAAPPAWACDCC